MIATEWRIQIRRVARVQGERGNWSHEFSDQFIPLDSPILPRVGDYITSQDHKIAGPVVSVQFHIDARAILVDVED